MLSCGIGSHCHAQVPSRQRWDRPNREHAAARRVETGDLTLAARLAFWDPLPPEDRVLPDLAASASGPVS